MSHVTTIARPAAEPALPSPAKPVRPSLAGGGRILPIIPQDLDQVQKLAGIIARSGSAPKSYRSDGGAGPVDVDMVCAAILVGLEVGLAPMAAVSGIVMFDDGPAIWGDARDGLVAASGLLVDMKEEIELDEAGIFTSATCTVWRKDRPTPTVQTVTRGQAALAGWLEGEAWKTNPNRMAQMRAKGWANRDAFPDVLKGLRSYDEAQDYVDVTSKGAATTAPPPPRRADFVAPASRSDDAPTTEDDAPAAYDAEPIAQEHEAAPEGWPLYDETGETVGTFPAVKWVDEFERMVSDLDGPRVTSAIDNNRETAAKVVKECADELGTITAEGLSASFEFVQVVAADDPLEDEKQPADLVPAGTQEECADKLVALIKAAATVSRVNKVVNLNIDRVRGWTKASRDRVFEAQDTQLDHLQSGGDH